MEQLMFNRDDYDLDGLLGKSEMAGADLVFMIYEEETDSYYMDRMEVRKYDSGFNRFMTRVKDYLEQDEAHGLFVLFATIRGGIITLYDGSRRQIEGMKIGDIDEEEDSFYGILIQNEEDELVFHQVLYINENYEGDARAQLIHNAGILTDQVQGYIEAFK